MGIIGFLKIQYLIILKINLSPKALIMAENAAIR